MTNNKAHTKTATKPLLSELIMSEHTSAVLCIAHDFTCASFQFQVITHKLLIYRCEVNYLCDHFEFHFQQNFAYFSSYFTFYFGDLFTSTTLNFQLMCNETWVPRFLSLFLKHLSGFHCRKRPSPTFGCISSHGPCGVIDSVAGLIGL